MANLGLQNKNPGNLKDPSTGKFRVFSDPSQGRQALVDDLNLKMSGGSAHIKPNQSLQDFASVWAPSSDNNNPRQYAKTLAQHMGVDTFTPIGSLKNRVNDFADAIQKAEGTSSMKSSFKVATPQPEALSGSLSQPSGNTLASKIKAKYPQYNDIPDSELEQKILAKHPEYQDLASESQPASPSPSIQSGYVTPPEVTPIATPPDQPQESKELLGKLLGGAQSMGQSLASPLLGMAALPVQAGVAGYNALTGSDIQDPYKNGMPVTGLGNVPVTPLDLEKKAGDAAQVGSYFVPGSGVLGAAGMGALQGAGSAMSQGKDLGSVAGQGALGAGIGAGTAVAAKGIGYGLNKLGETLNGKGQAEAIQGIKDAYGSALNLNASERAFESRSGKDIAQVLMENKAPLGKYANGTLDATEAITKLQDTLNPLNEQATSILSRPQGVVKNVPLADIFDAVKTRISSSRIPASQEKAMLKQAQQFLSDEARKYGAEVTPEIADAIKQGFQNSVFKKAITPEGILTNNVQYLLSDELKSATERAVAGTDTEISLKALNLQRSNLVDAIKRLSKLDGARLLKGGRLGNMAGGLVGTIIGSQSGGLVGGLAGDYFGTKAATFLNNPSTKIGTATAKAKVMGSIPKLLGSASTPIGNALSATGRGVAKSARAAGLISNLLTK